MTPLTAADLSPDLLAALPVGVVLWSFMEYVLHRPFHTARGRGRAASGRRAGLDNHAPLV